MQVVKGNLSDLDSFMELGVAGQIAARIVAGGSASAPRAIAFPSLLCIGLVFSQALTCFTHVRNNFVGGDFLQVAVATASSLLVAGYWTHPA